MFFFFANLHRIFFLTPSDRLCFRNGGPTLRAGQPAFACEPMINGDYRKYNNNSGAVVSREEERNTPQAFSHFTYIHSDRKHIIIDIRPLQHIVWGSVGMGALCRDHARIIRISWGMLLKSVAKGSEIEVVPSLGVQFIQFIV